MTANDIIAPLAFLLGIYNLVFNGAKGVTEKINKDIQDIFGTVNELEKASRNYWTSPPTETEQLGYEINHLIRKISRASNKHSKFLDNEYKTIIKSLRQTITGTDFQGSSRIVHKIDSTFIKNISECCETACDYFSRQEVSVHRYIIHQIQAKITKNRPLALV